MPRQADSTPAHAIKSRNLTPFWLLLPSIILIAAVQLYPALYTFYLSARRLEPGTGERITVGLANFTRLLQNPSFFASLTHTAVFLAGYVLLTLSLALGVALLLNQRLRLTPLYLTLIFIPWVIADVIVGVVWRLFVVPEYGLFAPFFANPQIFGAPDGISILTTIPQDQISATIPLPPAPALLFLTVASSWKTLPFITLLLLAALQTVPRELLESAAIDGARRRQALRYITLPLIWPMITVALFNLVLGGVNRVGMVFSLTSGGPGTATTVLSYLLYTLGFVQLDFGMAAALSVCMAILNFTVVALILRTTHQRRQAA